MSTIDIREPLPSMEKEKKVFDTFYEDCGVYFLFHPKRLETGIEMPACLSQAVVQYNADMNDSFINSYGKVVLMKYIEIGRHAFFDDDQIRNLVLKEKAVLSPEVKIRANLMRLRIMAASHFCEEMYDMFHEKEYFEMFRKDILLIRLDNSIHRLQIENELFEDQECIDIFKCFASRITTWLDQHDPTKESSQKLLHWIKKDYGQFNYFNVIYNVID